MNVLTVSTDLTTVTCGACGGVYAIAKRYRANKEEKGGFWNCPYCQASWGFGDSTINQLRRELNAARARSIRECGEHDQTRAELRETEARRRAEKAAKTRLKNRVAAGVCPCCKRHFTNLERHMATKHPDYGKRAKEQSHE